MSSTERGVMLVKRTMLALMVATMVIGPIGLVAAHASPAAPRAAVAAPRAAESPAAPAGPCINIDGDNRVLCLFNGNPGAGCKEILGVGRLVDYYRCGEPRPKPNVPIGCANLNGDNQFTCLGPAEPSGNCTQTFSLLIIHNYDCSKNSGRLGLRRH
jgi:hypothetical protein